MWRRFLTHSLYLQVLLGVLAGVLLGHFQPHAGEAMKPLADGFLKLIRMLIAPIVFSTIVAGIAGMGDPKKVGRIGVAAIVYFEVVTSLAMLIGLGIVHLVGPGEGLHVDVRTIDTHAVDAVRGVHHGVVETLLDILPTTFVDAFAKGEMLQVLLLAALFGFGVLALGERGRDLAHFFERIADVLFRVVGFIMRLSPIGAFGAMAFTVGKYGIATIGSLGKLLGSFYLTSLVFVCVVLALLARWAGVSVFRLVRYLRDELFVVLGTSSSESVLPQLMTKLESMGCARSVVRLVVPLGYSFNLDGTSIYLTMGALFVAQATDTHLTLGQQLAILGVLLLTSKGAAAVTGGGFIVLAATLSSTGTIPVAGLALLLGVDRFMSEARALTNLVGNAVATIVIAKWQGQLDVGEADRALGVTVAAADSPAAPS